MTNTDLLIVIIGYTTLGSIFACILDIIRLYDTKLLNVQKKDLPKVYTLIFLFWPIAVILHVFNSVFYFIKRS